MTDEETGTVGEVENSGAGAGSTTRQRKGPESKGDSTDGDSKPNSDGDSKPNSGDGKGTKGHRNRKLKIGLGILFFVVLVSIFLATVRLPQSSVYHGDDDTHCGTHVNTTAAEVDRFHAMLIEELRAQCR